MVCIYSLKNQQQNKIDEISMQIVHVMTSRCFALQKKEKKEEEKKGKRIWIDSVKTLFKSESLPL